MLIRKVVDIQEKRTRDGRGGYENYIRTRYFFLGFIPVFTSKRLSEQRKDGVTTLFI